MLPVRSWSPKDWAQECGFGGSFVSVDLSIVGQRVGKLEVLSLVSFTVATSRWACRCECGQECVRTRAALKSSTPPSCDSCRVPEEVAAAQSYQEDRERLGDEEPLLPVMRRYMYSAQARGLPFTLGTERFLRLVKGACFYCGESDSNVHRAAGSDWAYNGIDRWMNSLGYEDGNVVSCCKTCNMSKGTMSGEEYIAHCQRVALHSSTPASAPGLPN